MQQFGVSCPYVYDYSWMHHPVSVRYKLSHQKPSCTQMTSLQKNKTDMAEGHTFHTLFYMSAS